MRLMRLMYDGLTLMAETGFWLLRGAGETGAILHDIKTARASMATGVLRCPRGHEIPIDGEVYECGCCGFVWEGSALRCPNPECEAPATAFVECPTCRLSRRNPARWGTP